MRLSLGHLRKQDLYALLTNAGTELVALNEELTQVKDGLSLHGTGHKRLCRNHPQK
jgi:hypothetical protein